MGPGVAQECIETKDGPVIWEDHFYPEIIDPQTGEVMPDGREGELVLTSLSKEALPVIRFRTRDRTVLLPPTARSMRRIGRITGRTDDMLIIRGVNVFPTQIEELILRQPELAAQYLLEIVRDGPLDALIVKVELAAAHAIDATVRSSAAQALARNVKAHVGISVDVRICEPNQLPRFSGKAQRVVDKRDGERR
jgi:phenylacetate-CoA ligase